MVVPGQAQGRVLDLMLIAGFAVLGNELLALYEEQEYSMLQVVVNYCEFDNLMLPGNGLFQHPGEFEPPPIPTVPPPPEIVVTDPPEPHRHGDGVEDEDEDENPYIGQVAPPGHGQRSKDHSGSSTKKYDSVFRGEIEDGHQNYFPFVVAIAEEPVPYRVYNPLNLDFDPSQVSQENPVIWPFTSCTGIILSASLVLTASHCITSPFNRVIVTAGAECRPELGGILEQWEHVAGHAQIRRARKFERRYPNNLGAALRYAWAHWDAFDLPFADIAIVQVDEPFDLSPQSGISAIDLIEDTDCQNEWHHVWPTRDATRRLTSAGWGRFNQYAVNQMESESVETTKLRWYDLEYATQTNYYTRDAKDRGNQFRNENDRCNGTLHPTDGWICLPVAPGISPQSCKGDSGGPLFKREREGAEESVNELIGVMSTCMTWDEEDERQFSWCGYHKLLVWVRLCGQTLNWINHKIQNGQL